MVGKIRPIRPLLLLCVVLFCLNLLWHQTFVLEQEQSLLNDVSSTTPNACFDPLGDDLFYQGAARQSCDRHDTYYARWMVSTTRFNQCMDDLQRAQQTYHSNSTTTASCRCEELIHVYWKGPLPETARLGILSILYTYRDYPCMKLRVWVQDAETEVSLRQQLPPQGASLEIVRLDLAHLSQRIVQVHPRLTALMDQSLPNLISLSSEKAVGFSDVVRVFVLSAYGGVYLDCDMLVLQRFTPLLGPDFYYRWNVRRLANTAAMHLRLGSENAFLLLNKSLQQSRFGQRNLAKLLHPHSLYQMLHSQRKSMELLPNGYFDPLWIIMKNPASLERYGLKQWDDFFTLPTNASPQHFFEGSFCFHWHNQWNSPIVDGSLAHKFLQQYKEVVEVE